MSSRHRAVSRPLSQSRRLTRPIEHAQVGYSERRTKNLGTGRLHTTKRRRHNNGRLMRAFRNPIIFLLTPNVWLIADGVRFRSNTVKAINLAPKGVYCFVSSAWTSRGSFRQSKTVSAGRSGHQYLVNMYAECWICRILSRKTLAENI